MPKCASAILIIMLFVNIATSAFAASSSTSYRITTQKISFGAAVAGSSSYQMRGGPGRLELQLPASASFVIGEGFLRSAYFTWVIFAPIVTSIDPTTAANDKSVSVVISGANFVSGATAKLTLSGEADMVAINVVVVSPSKITCDFNLTDAKPDLWNVTVANPDGRSGTLPSAFKITYAAPTVTSIVPSRGYNNETVSVIITGTYFRSGASAALSMTGESDIVADNVRAESASKITGQFNLTGKNVGLWDVSVTNDDGQKGTLSLGFKIEALALEVIGPIQIQPSPNPAAPSIVTATIKYNLSQDTDITINIYNIRGEKIWSTTMPAGTAGGQAGVNQVFWEGITAFRNIAPAGVYFVHVTARVDGQIKLLAKEKFGIVK